AMLGSAMLDSAVSGSAMSGSARMASAAASPAPADKAFTKANPYPARLIINERLNGEGASKDTRQFGFDLRDSALSYEAGDTLGVWQQNCLEVVAELEQLLQLNAETPVLIDAYERPLRDALLKSYDICRVNLDTLNFIAERSGKIGRA